MSADESRLDLSSGTDGVLTLVGEIDGFTAPDLAARLSDDATIDVVDLADVTFIDSSGLRVLLQSHHDRVSTGSTLTLRAPSASVQRLLEISGLESHLLVD